MKLKRDILSLSASKILDLILSLSILYLLMNEVDPQYFGYYAYILGITALLNPFLDLGLTEAYITKNEKKADVSSLYFSLNCVAGGTLALSVAVCGFILSNNQSNMIIFYYALSQSGSYIMLSLSRQANASVLKNGDFVKIGIIGIVSSVVTLAVLYSAYLLKAPDFFYLPLRYLVPVVIQVIGIYFIVDKFFYKIEFKIIRSHYQSIKFGGWVLANRILSGLFNSFERFVILNLFPLNITGQVSTGIQIYRMVDIYYRMPISSVFFSYISKIKIEQGTLNSNVSVNNFIRIIWLGLIFVGVMATLVLPILLPWVVPSEWDVLIDIMPILVLAAIPISTFGILTTANIILETQKDQFILNCICIVFLGVSYIIAVTLDLGIDTYLKLFITVMLVVSSLAVVKTDLKLNGQEYIFISLVAVTILTLLDNIWFKTLSNYWLMTICFMALLLLKKEMKRLSFG